MKRENDTAFRAGSTGDSGRRNRFPIRIHTKRAEVRRFYAPSALKNGNGLSDRSYVTSSLSPFPIASENLPGSVLGKMKSEKNFLCEPQEGSL